MLGNGGVLKDCQTSFHNMVMSPFSIAIVLRCMRSGEMSDTIFREVRAIYSPPLSVNNVIIEALKKISTSPRNRIKVSRTSDFFFKG